MGERPTFDADLGHYFASLRAAAGFASQRQAALLARKRGIQVSYQQLQRLEAGKTKAPDVSLLRSLSRLYGIGFEVLLSELWRRQYEVSVEPTAIKRDKVVPRPPVVIRPQEAAVIELMRRLPAAKQEHLLRLVRDFIESHSPLARAKEGA